MTGVMEERFAAFLRPGYFSRVDNQHPLELYIGLDEKGRKAIELRARFTARKVTGTSAIDFQNQLRVVDIAGHPLAEHPCNPEDVIRIIEVVLHPAIADLIQKIIQSPIQFVNPASGEVGGIF